MIDAVARDIATALAAEVDAPVRASSIDATAMQLYLRARFEYLRSWGSTAKEAAALFEQALALAPDDPNILAGCARAHMRMLAWGEGDERTLERAHARAARAVELAPTNGNAWAATAEAYWHGGDATSAVRALLTGLDQAPQVAVLHDLLGRLLAEVGAIEPARHHLRTALAFDPSLNTSGVDLA